MSVLTSGRKEPCKDNVGGIQEIWLTSFQSYSAKLMVGYKNMVLTSFPTTLMYEYKGNNKRFDENLSDGAYTQNIQMKLTKQSYEDVALLEDLIKNKLRAVILDGLGFIRVAGLHNGLDASIRTSSGGSKFDFNGYELTMTGLEPYSAPYLGLFPGSGFVKEGVTFDCLLASSDKLASLQDKVASCNIAQ